jgi:hypothetical protein
MAHVRLKWPPRYDRTERNPRPVVVRPMSEKDKWEPPTQEEIERRTRSFGY